LSFAPVIDLATMLALKKLDAEFLRQNIAKATRAYTAKQTRSYRYRGVTFRTSNAKGTDGWYSAWERQRARNRRRRSPK
jgi:hypothetical protein